MKDEEIMRFFAPILIAITLAFPQISAQVYEVDSIYFPADTALDRYLEQHELRPASVRGLMEMGAKEEFGGLRLQVETGKDEAVLRPLNGKGGGGAELKRTGETLYQRSSSGGQRFEELKVDDDKLIYTFGEYRQLEKPEDPGEAFKELKNEYGEEFPANQISLILVEAGETAEAFNGTFKVTDVHLQPNEDVVDFGKEHVEMFMGFGKSHEERIQRQYMGTVYDIKIEGSRASISAKGEGGSMSFSGKLDQVEEGVYRVEIMKSFYDLYTNGGLDEDFSVNKIVYSNFISPEEEYQELEEYQKLRRKYGEKLPYNNVVQEVEEVE